MSAGKWEMMSGSGSLRHGAREKVARSEATRKSGGKNWEGVDFAVPGMSEVLLKASALFNSLSLRNISLVVLHGLEDGDHLFGRPLWIISQAKHKSNAEREEHFFFFQINIRSLTAWIAHDLGDTLKCA